jgi:N-acetylglutamate synthase-like GNAT family acetyltransferase/acyl-coenzyme A thioesterase PaaI-like protein
MTTTEADKLVIGPRAAQEIGASEELVAAAGLPVEGVAAASAFLVARDGEELVGTVALDVFGETGLLRSLAVTPKNRGNGLGRRLCDALLGRAAELGLRRVFLLTLEAPFFARLGFEECERSIVPGDLAASFQFTAGVCATATCMVFELGGGEALQDLYPGNHCFGCGPRNRAGLRLKSFRAGDATVARFLPSPEHNAGPEAWLNGGIVATLLDCHGIFAAIADAYRREGRPFASAPLIWYVTGSLSVRYERPIPIDREVRLVARVQTAADRKTAVECALYSVDTVCARASVVAVRVEEGWKTSRGGR